MENQDITNYKSTFKYSKHNYGEFFINAAQDNENHDYSTEINYDLTFVCNQKEVPYSAQFCSIFEIDPEYVQQKVVSTELYRYLTFSSV